MDPILLQLGPFAIRWYGFLITLAIFVGFYLAERRLRAQGQDVELFDRAAVWAVIWGVIGARVVYVLTSWGNFAHNPLAALYIWQGGLSFHGAILGGVLAFLYFRWRYGAPFYAFVEAALPGVALGIIGGRIGNFMNGSDTVGRLTTLPIGFTWPESAVGFPGICTATGDLAYGVCLGEVVRGPVHLTQLYGAFIGLVLLVLVYRWYAAKRPEGYVFWNFVLWYSVLRSVLEEPFRLNPLWWPVYTNDALGVGLFTATQLVSIPLVLLALYQLGRLKARA